ncbi:threonine/serine dehydratase [Candidatus Bathyarchaeota archaeon]|nr:threonine/serine dehydratase [Candidatus Bathyarchaeota archaeon]MBT4320328.1 threonine/serine dehydratase [Candidatus Bathyarchaeota archaeon]MBT4424433.1 threonine/serine dehydratase [Candidatus Bathyarchaeota archaeon]MBT5642912.1 threonine/serine dehydratase [Candidatus Bathyarchaeota archaeon]MBT6604817.1 threonine/serine dehydratase [Candidatus Bathyarchaeota archaeon]
MKAPELIDIISAQQRIKPYLNPSPLLTYPTLNEYLGFKAYIKHENYNPTGAFKIRGGINLVSQLTPEEKEKGVITASTGNHGQSIALAGKMFGVQVHICVPVGANPGKIAAIRSHGAQIHEYGRDFDEAVENGIRLAEEHGYLFINSGNEPRLIAGVGTIGLEIIQQLPDVDVVVSPVGSGTGAGGTATAVKSLKPGVKTISIQAVNAPSIHMSYLSGKPESTPTANTFADGLATRNAFELPLGILREHVDDFMLVSEDEMRNAIRLYAEHCHTIAEGAGAATLAGAIKLKEQLRGKKVVLVLSGGNLSYEELIKCLK